MRCVDDDGVGGGGGKGAGERHSLVSLSCVVHVLIITTKCLLTYYYFTDEYYSVFIALDVSDSLLVLHNACVKFEATHKSTVNPLKFTAAVVIFSLIHGSSSSSSSPAGVHTYPRR